MEYKELEKIVRNAVKKAFSFENGELSENVQFENMSDLYGTSAVECGFKYSPINCYDGMVEITVTAYSEKMLIIYAVIGNSTCDDVDTAVEAAGKFNEESTTGWAVEEADEYFLLLVKDLEIETDYESEIAECLSSLNSAEFEDEAHTLLSHYEG
jgi:hypothetical protein